MDLPAHPQRHDDHESAPPTINRATVLVVTLVLALLAVLVILHLTGVVGPAAD
jgi:hypothetical protein